MSRWAQFVPLGLGPADRPAEPARHRQQPARSAQQAVPLGHPRVHQSLLAGARERGAAVQPLRSTLWAPARSLSATGTAAWFPVPEQSCTRWMRRPSTCACRSSHGRRFDARKGATGVFWKTVQRALAEARPACRPEYGVAGATAKAATTAGAGEAAGGPAAAGPPNAAAGRSCEIPGYPTPADPERLGLRWCPSSVGCDSAGLRVAGRGSVVRDCGGHVVVAGPERRVGRLASPNRSPRPPDGLRTVPTDHGRAEPRTSRVREPD